MRDRGFTLVEIMIVIAIIATLAAIAIPNLLRARVNANEAAAIGSLKAISNSATSYRAANPTFPSTLSSLAAPNATPPYVDALLGAGAKHGYTFRLTGSTYTFTATATPQIFGSSGNRSFYVDASGLIKYCTTSGCDASTGSAL